MPKNTEEDEHWEEALDIDDDQIPFLKPCKRPKPSLLPNSNPSSSSPPSSRRQFLIPGPAGAVQLAMERKSRVDGMLFYEDLIPTQEYIRKVIEDGDASEDEDFRADPWLSALDFLRTEGMVDGDCSVPGTPLGSIKKGFRSDRAALVVAIIKSCTPNGLGSLMVTLKDPTGTIDASIHHKVLSQGEFGKIISVGSVLILQKVPAFAPFRSTFFLNITLNNVIKVISKNTGPPIEHNYAPSLRYAAKSSESNERSHTAEPVISQKRTEGIMSSLNKNRVVDLSENSSFISNEHCRNSLGNAAEKECSFTNTPVLSSTHSSDRATVADEQFIDGEQSRADNLSCRVETATTATAQNLVEVSAGDKEPEKEFGSENLRKVSGSTTSMPDWTDEQLDELFEFDD
ncbi:hypothetical protein CsatB_016095 [Cannabis sativa]